jgi:flagellar protein FlgJ
MPSAAQVEIEYGLPAAGMVAQVALETGWLANVTADMTTGKTSNNLFNIKGSYNGQSVQAMTTEYVNGVAEQLVQTFRAYANYEESFADYAALITGSSTYARAVAAENDPVAYAQALQACGYATAPNYAQELISIMTEYNLASQAEEAVVLALPITTDAAGNIIKVGAVPAYGTTAVAEAVSLGLLSQTHNPNAIPTYGELCAILLNAKQKGITI